MKQINDTFPSTIINYIKEAKLARYNTVLNSLIRLMTDVAQHGDYSISIAKMGNEAPTITPQYSEDWVNLITAEPIFIDIVKDIIKKNDEPKFNNVIFDMSKHYIGFTYDLTITWDKNSFFSEIADNAITQINKAISIIYNEISNRLNGGSKCFVIPINNLCCSDNQLEVVINILERNKIEAVVQFNKLGITWDKITTLILDNT